MVLKHIAALCKSRRRIDLFYDEQGTQWISTGTAAYPLYGMPALDAETVSVVLDIPEKDRKKYVIREIDMPEGVSFRDYDDTERLLRAPNLSIGYNGDVLETARTSLGLLFYRRDAVKPLSDLKDGYEIYERETGEGDIYLAVKTGFLLRAIIMPVAIRDERLAEQLQELHDELRTTISYYAMREREKAEDAGQGDLFDQPETDPETGEVLA